GNIKRIVSIWIRTGSRVRSVVKIEQHPSASVKRGRASRQQIYTAVFAGYASVVQRWGGNDGRVAVDEHVIRERHVCARRHRKRLDQRMRARSGLVGKRVPGSTCCADRREATQRGRVCVPRK